MKATHDIQWLAICCEDDFRDRSLSQTEWCRIEIEDPVSTKRVTGTPLTCKSTNNPEKWLLPSIPVAYPGWFPCFQIQVGHSSRECPCPPQRAQLVLVPVESPLLGQCIRMWPGSLQLTWKNLRNYGTWKFSHVCTGKPCICNVSAHATWWAGLRAHINVTTFTRYLKNWRLGCIVWLYDAL
jgi:hypothetical protein